MALHTHLSEQEARDTREHYRPHQEKKLQEVEKALREALADCNGDAGLLTQDAVRVKLSSKSSGTIQTYLPVIWALVKVEFEVTDPPTDDPWPALSAGERRVFQAVADLVASIKVERSRLEAASHVQLASAVAGGESRLQEEIQRRMEAEQAVLSVASESDQRANQIEHLEEELAAVHSDADARCVQLSALRHELEIATAKLATTEAEVASNRLAEADLRGDLAAARLELNAERQRSSDGLAALDAMIKAREFDANNVRNELEEIRRQHREEIAQLGRDHREELTSTRAVHAQEVDAERSRNAELAVAVTEALKVVGTAVGSTQ